MPVGLIYDPVYLQHDTGEHPESAARLTGILQQLQADDLSSSLQFISPQAASAEQLARVHTADYVANLENSIRKHRVWLNADTVVSEHSWQAALYAAGGAITATSAVLAKKVSSAFALVRPPGHHARPGQSMGFCLLNNIAIAARWAQAEAGLQRVAIIDFDVHHGNGTAEALDADDNLLYISLHAHPFYPFTGDWNPNTRRDAHAGPINIPLALGSGDRAYAYALQRIVLPALRRHAPEFILVSAGYDTHLADPIGPMVTTIAGQYAWVRQLLDEADRLCQGRIAFCLEGGYDHEALAQGVCATISAMLGRDYPDRLGAPPPGHEVYDPALLDRMASYYGFQTVR